MVNQDNERETTMDLLIIGLAQLIKLAATALFTRKA